MFKSRIRTPCVHLIGTYNQGDLSGLFIYHNIPILQIIMAKSYWLIDARQRLLQQRNLIAKLIQLKLFGLFLGTPDTSLLKPPPDSDNTKQISLWSAITHICLNDNRRWHKKNACLSLSHSETSLGPWDRETPSASCLSALISPDRADRPQIAASEKARVQAIREWDITMPTDKFWN